MNSSNVTLLNHQNKTKGIWSLALTFVLLGYGVYFYFYSTSSISTPEKEPGYSIDSIPPMAVNLSTTPLPISLNKDLYFFRDSSKSLDIHNIQKLETAVFSKIEKQGKINLGVSNNPIWFLYKTLITSKKPKDNRMLIEMTFPQALDIDFFMIRGDGELYKIEGSKQTPKNYMGHYNEIFPLPFIAEEEISIFIKLEAENHITFDLLLWSQNAFSSKSISENFLFGLFYGSLGLMAFYNLLIFLQTQDRSYLYFVLYVSFVTCFQLVYLGHGQLFDYWGKTLFQLKFSPYYLWAACLSIIVFVQSFLQTKERHPAMHFCLNVSLSITLFQIITSIFTTYQTTFTWLAYFVTLVFFFIFVVISICYYLGNKNAKFLLWGWMLNMAGACVLALVYLDAIPPLPILFYAPLITLSIGSAFLTFALSERIKQNEKDALHAKKRSIRALARYEDTFNNAIEGIYSMSLNGDFINANPALTNMLGYDSEETLKQDSKRSSRMIYRNPENTYKELAKNNHIQEEITFIVSNKPLWALHSARIAFDSQGTPSHIEGTLVNISDKKLKELAQLRKEKEAIEKEEALHASKAKSQFLANMSHELRTPLTAIIGYSEALTEEKSSESRKEYLEIISRSGNHLIELINDVLDLSKVEANQLEINTSEINLCHLLQDTESYFKIKAQEKGIYFNIDHQWPLPSHIVADATRTKQILLNLCSNAVKFTQQGGVTIDVKLLRDQQLLAIEIQDSGIGLTPEQQDKLFQSYTQADTSTTRQFGGTGLGLVISKQFAERMGGDITVTSQQNKGSCFTLTLGLESTKDIQLANNEAEFSQLTEDKESQQSLPDDMAKRILVIDADPDCSYVLKQLLSPNQREIIVTNNYVSALDAIERAPLDLALIDINTLKNFEDNADTLIGLLNNSKKIALTADVVHGHKEALTFGFTTTIEKPFSKPMLYETIRKFFANGD